MKIIDLQHWCSFYQNVCELVLKSSDEGENEKQRLRELFYLYYKSDAVYDLTPMELALVMLLAAGNLDGKVCSQLQLISQMFSENNLTFRAASSILSAFLNGDDLTWEPLFDKDGVFQQYFVTITDQKSRNMNSVISLKDHVIPALQGRRISVKKASFCLEYAENDRHTAMIGRQKETDWLKDIFVKVILPGRNGVIQLKGDAGEGKKHTVSYLAGYFYQELLILDGRYLVNMNMEDIRSVLDLAEQAVFFNDALLYLDLNGLGTGADSEDGEMSNAAYKLFAVLSMLQQELRYFIVGGSCQISEWIRSSSPLYICEWEHMPAAEQKQLWRHFAKEQSVELSEDISEDELVSVYDLTPRTIEAVIKMCVPFAAETYSQKMITRQLLTESIKKMIVANFDRMVTKLESPFGWEDLKVSEQTRKKMQSAIQRIRYRNVVNDSFGFGKKLPYGQGVVIALYGPSGTGKTMAATVIANELNLDIYRIDLSQVSSKYIGESEKNLARIFDTAKNSNAILFFDEADSLFAKRTDVGSANDKYANAETGFLLQKLEEYRGLSILATNLLQSFDAAFKRRITYMIPLERPTEAEQLELWKSIFPKEAPLAEDVRFETFVRYAGELTGSGIKSAAIAAAYHAAADNRRITQKDIAEAVNDEYMKTGHTSILNKLWVE